MPPGVRRVVYILTAGTVLARLFVLGRERGWDVVGPVALRVTLTALAAWAVHVVVHELAHLVAARRMDFEVRAVRFGPVLIDLMGERARVALQWRDLGGGVTSLPRGLARLAPRMRVVAAAGPTATLLLSAATLGWYAALGAPGLSSVPGIAMTMGGFVLVTALLPGALLPNAPPAGSDVDQLVFARRVRAHWTHAAVLQGVVHGKLVGDQVPWAVSKPLLPREDEDVEPIVLLHALACLEAGEVERARHVLEQWLPRLDDAYDWLRVDLNSTAGCLFALVDGDVARAEACLGLVRAEEAFDWYGHLLAACICRAKGDEAGFREWLGKWKAAIAEHPNRAFALAGNAWVLRRLGE